MLIYYIRDGLVIALICYVLKGEIGACIIAICQQNPLAAVHFGRSTEQRQGWLSTCFQHYHANRNENSRKVRAKGQLWSWFYFFHSNRLHCFFPFVNCVLQSFSYLPDELTLHWQNAFWCFFFQKISSIFLANNFNGCSFTQYMLGHIRRTWHFTGAKDPLKNDCIIHLHRSAFRFMWKKDGETIKNRSKGKLKIY